MTSKVEELREKLQGLIGDVVRQMPPNVYGNPDDTIPPVIDALISAAKQEAVVEYLAKKLVETIEAGSVEIVNGLMAVRKLLDKLGAWHE